MSTYELLRRLAPVLAIIALVGLVPAGQAQAADPDALWFMENMGQRQVTVAFHATGATFISEIGADGALETQSLETGATVKRLTYDGASAAPALTGADRLGEALFAFADKPGALQDNVGVFGTVDVEDLYAGIDVAYSGTFSTLQRAFEVGTGADPLAVRMRYAGLTPEMAPDGSLQLRDATGGVAFVETVRRAYQDIGGVPVAVDVDLAIRPDVAVGFDAESYDPTHPLIVELALDCSAVIDVARETAARATQGDPGSAPVPFTQVTDGVGVIGGLSAETVADSASEKAERVAAPAALIVGADLGGGDLTPADGDVLSGTFTNVGTFHVMPGVTVFVDPSVPLTVQATEILIEGAIDATAAGAAGGATPGPASSPGNPGQGPGGGQGGGFGNCVHGAGGGGGGYGGQGGNSSSLFGYSPDPALGGPAYGDPNPPGIMTGSGGGSGANFCNATNQGKQGGAGGGTVTLDGLRVTVSGAVLANGADGVSNLVAGPAGGGGSGGGILLNGCLTLDNAVFAAGGGAGGDARNLSGLGMAGGGGGGGRIKLSGTFAPGAAYASGVTGGAAGFTDALILAQSVAATAGADGSVVDSATDNGGPCVQAPPSVGGHAVGEVQVAARESRLGVAGADTDRLAWLAFLSLALIGALALGAGRALRRTA